ncbi:MAG: hypothetical protein GY823_03985 [Flavobacteriaceae bacterium]|nr:hypothetical protein [Flavobacteriaceae bacterium]
MAEEIETRLEDDNDTKNEKSNEKEIENDSDILIQLYDFMPSLATYVLFARKMNSTRKSDDQNKNTIDNMLAVLSYLVNVPLEELEDTHNLYTTTLEEIAIEDEEKQNEHSEIDYLNKKREDVKNQLDIINKLDKQVIEAVIKLEDNIEKANKVIELAKQTGSKTSTTSNNIINEWGGGTTNDFNSLFEEQTIIPPGFDQEIQIPPVFDQNTLPTALQQEGEIPPLIRQITVSTTPN